MNKNLKDIKALIKGAFLYVQITLMTIKPWEIALQHGIKTVDACGRNHI
ncbi:hypothetical protein ACQQ4G_003134 [Listeria monocytogenes]